jgi:NAD(P)-dependent dehydrogenase (short-subunit alcohol dehydrogenase family)
MDTPSHMRERTGRLQGRRAIITGAARGIGASIAALFAAEGAQLALIDMRANDLLTVATALDARSFVADLADRDQVNASVTAAVASLGGVDVLVNNAGVLRFSPILEITADEWDLMFDVNVRSMLFTTQIVARHMIQQGRGDQLSAGKIINMASMGAKIGSPLQAHYCASKAAVVSFTQVSAMEFGTHGINVNCICPGYVMTEMGASTRTPAMIDAWSAKSPLGRLAEPTDVARMALFLASADSDYSTGQAMNVSGGMVMH